MKLTAARLAIFGLALSTPPALVWAAQHGEEKHVYGPNYGNDRAQIEDLMSRYLFAFDWQDGEAYAATFTKDGILDFAGGIEQGHDELKKVMDDMAVREKAKADASFPYHRQRVRHYVTNLVLETPDWDVVVPRVEGDPDGLNYLADKHLSEMVLGAADGTAYAYAKEQRPSMNVLIPQLNAFTMGQLIYMFELATVAEGYLMGINPMDQPGVEAYKNFMFGNLGRADKAAYKAEFDARPKGSSEFVV